MAGLIQANAQPPFDSAGNVSWRSDCGVVIPCLNEATALAELLPAVRKILPSVIVIDDGSRDDTGGVAARAGATVLRHDRPLGKGAALATGLSWLHQRRFSWALLMDGDGQHAAEDIPSFFRAAEESRASLIIGNRMAAASQMPWLRRAVNRWMSARLSSLAGRPLPDTQCGFRLLQVPVWAGLRLHTSHFEIESELLWATLQAGGKVVFVPVRAIYGREQTKINPLRDSWRWLRWWCKVSRPPRGPH